jgi:uncharacterized membrane protein YgaE (UPF0421/DUF939 family)
VTIRRIDGDDVRRAIKMALAASIAWTIGVLAGEPAPVFAAIVPLVAIRRSDPFSAISVSAGRILGVFVGVLIGLCALQTSEDVTVPLAIGTICVSLVAGLVLRVGDEPNVQIAVSALIMLFLSDSAGSSGIDRIWETAIGAAVAAVVATLLWPPNPLALVRAELPLIRKQLCEDLTATINLLRDPSETEQLLERVRDHQLAARDEALKLPQAEKSLRWNLRHRGDATELEPLAARMVLVSRLHRHLRSLARSIADATPESIEEIRPSARDLRRSADDLVAALQPRMESDDVQSELDRAATALDDFSAAQRGRLATVIEVDMRRMITDLRTGRVEGEALRG